MIISFSVFKDKIENSEKCQTIRPYNEKRFRTFANAKKYQLYWHNPRNGGKLIKEVEPEGEPIRVFFMEAWEDRPISLHGSNNEEEKKLWEYSNNGIARRDGFKDFPEMVQWFQKKYGSKFLRPNEFMIIRWVP